MKIVLSKYQKSKIMQGLVRGGIPYFGEAINELLLEMACKYSHDAYRKVFEEVKSDLNQVKRVKSELKVCQMEEPILCYMGEQKLNKNQQRKSQNFKKDLKAPDDICGIVTDEPEWNDQPLIIRYKNLPYSGVLALRDSGFRVRILSGNGLIVCEDIRALVLHRRSEISQDYPYTIHTIGGAFIPQVSETFHNDGFSIRDCIVREIHEEINIAQSIPPHIPFILINEFKINFIQGVCIGIPVNKYQVEQMRSNFEGDFLIIDFNQLEEKLLQVNSWTVSGWCHVMLWLGLDTPGLKSSPLFGNKTARQLYKFILNRAS